MNFDKMLKMTKVGNVALEYIFPNDKIYNIVFKNKIQRDAQFNKHRVDMPCLSNFKVIIF